MPSQVCHLHAVTPMDHLQSSLLSRPGADQVCVALRSSGHRRFSAASRHHLCTHIHKSTVPWEYSQLSAAYPPKTPTNVSTFNTIPSDSTLPLRPFWWCSGASPQQEQEQEKEDQQETQHFGSCTALRPFSPPSPTRGGPTIKKHPKTKHNRQQRDTKITPHTHTPPANLTLCWLLRSGCRPW